MCQNSGSISGKGRVGLFYFGEVKCKLLYMAWPANLRIPYIYNSNNPGAETDIPQVDTFPQGVKTPTLLSDTSWGQPRLENCSGEVPRHPGTIWPCPRIINPSSHVQLQQLGDENGFPRVDNHPARWFHTFLFRAVQHAAHCEYYSNITMHFRP